MHGFQGRPSTDAPSAPPPRSQTISFHCLLYTQETQKSLVHSFIHSLFTEYLGGPAWSQGLSSDQDTVIALIDKWWRRTPHRGQCRLIKSVMGVPWWLSRLKIQHCHCCSSGYICSMGSIPGSQTSTNCWCGGKKKCDESYKGQCRAQSRDLNVPGISPDRPQVTYSKSQAQEGPSCR